MDKFVFVGSKDLNDNTEAVDMLDGRFAAKGEEIELSETEAEQLKAGGIKLRKVGEADDSDEGEVSEADASDSGESKTGFLGSR